jgi:hypothetical protein
MKVQVKTAPNSCAEYQVTDLDQVPTPDYISALQKEVSKVVEVVLGHPPTSAQISIVRDYSDRDNLFFFYVSLSREISRIANAAIKSHFSCEELSLIKFHSKHL